VSSQEQTLPTGNVSSMAMIRTLGGIAMISGFLVVLVFQATLPAINENKRRAIERAVFQVIPGAVSRTDFLVDKSGVTPLAGTEASDGIKIYAGYDSENNLLGIAAEAAAQGYQDVIRILYGYNPECQCITGISVIKMTETPGLGDKIAKDPRFLANFDALDATLNAQGNGLRNPIKAVKHGSKTETWQIDAISGATISSNAIGKMLNERSQTLLPMLFPHVNKLKGKANGDS